MAQADIRRAVLAVNRWAEGGDSGEVSKILYARLSTPALLRLLITVVATANMGIDSDPAGLLVIEPLVLRISRRQDIEGQVRVHGVIVEVVVAPADEALREIVAPELPAVVSVDGLAAPRTVVGGGGAAGRVLAAQLRKPLLAAEKVRLEDAAVALGLVLCLALRERLELLDEALVQQGI